jgi:hypothetical protein
MHCVIKYYLWTAINPRNRAMNLDKEIDKVEKERRPKSDGCMFRETQVVTVRGTTIYRCFVV